MSLKDKAKRWHWEENNGNGWIGKDKPYYFEKDVKEAVLEYEALLNMKNINLNFVRKEFKQIFGEFEK